MNPDVIGINLHSPDTESQVSSVHTLLSLQLQGRGELLALTDGNEDGVLLDERDGDDVTESDINPKGDAVMVAAPNDDEERDGEGTGDSLAAI